LHFFELRNFQHFVLYLFPGLIFVFLFAASLAFMFFRRRDSEEREKRIIQTYIGEIEERNAPFPLIAFLIILGTVLWLFLYILLTGVLGVKI
jgi:amino acid transporter